LDRLERAVVDKQTAWEINQYGRVTWKARTDDLFRQIERHVQRDKRERFSEGKGKNPSYDYKQVDRVTDRIVDKAAAMLQAEGMTPQDVTDLASVDSKTVAHTVFTQRKGRRGYDERQVDYFLSACVQLLSRLESYERVSQYLTEHNPAARDALAGAPAIQPAVQNIAESMQAAAPAVRPLFAGTQPAAAASPSAPGEYGVGEETESFDAVNKAEQAIFNAPAAPVAQTASAAAAVPAAVGMSAPPSASPVVSPGAPAADVNEGGSASRPVNGPAEWGAFPAPVDRDADIAAAPAVQAVLATAPSPAAPPTQAAPGVTSVPDGSLHAGEETEAFAPISDYDDAGTAQDGDERQGGHNGQGAYKDQGGERQEARRDAAFAPPAAASQSVQRPVQPIQPAYAEAPAAAEHGHAVDDHEARRPRTPANPSLAALAHMAQISHDLPAVDTSPFKPEMPSLPTFSMPHFAFDPVHQPASSGDASDSGDSNGAERSDDVSFPQTGEDVDLGIPDLSFPTFDANKPGDDSGNAPAQ
jgi:DivIVA domain-containing protein